MLQKDIVCKRRTAVLGLTFLAGNFYLSSSWAQENTINVVTEEWAPYNYTENGVLKGFSVEIIQAIAKRLNQNIQIQFLPSMRATHILDNVPKTMQITMFRTPEREDKYKWIGPLGDGDIYFYKKKGNPLVISNLEDAKKVKKIACRHGGLVLNLLRAANFNNLDASSTDGISVYKKLLIDRCDLGISDTPLGVKHQLRKLDYPADALVQTAVKVVELPLYIACSKDIPDQEILLWQKALDEMKASGLYANIYKKYNE